MTLAPRGGFASGCFALGGDILSENTAPGFVVDGVEYPVVTDLLLGEARAIKRLYGVKLADIEALLNESDPDAMAAIVYVSMHRADPTVTPERVDLIDLTEFAIAAATVVEAAPDTPLADAADDAT